MDADGPSFRSNMVTPISLEDLVGNSLLAQGLGQSKATDAGA